MHFAMFIDGFSLDKHTMPAQLNEVYYSNYFSIVIETKLHCSHVTFQSWIFVCFSIIKFLYGWAEHGNKIIDYISEFNPKISKKCVPSSVTLVFCIQTSLIGVSAVTMPGGGHCGQKANENVINWTKYRWE